MTATYTFDINTSDGNAAYGPPGEQRMGFGATTFGLNRDSPTPHQPSTGRRDRRPR